MINISKVFDTYESSAGDDLICINKTNGYLMVLKESLVPYLDGDRSSLDTNDQIKLKNFDVFKTHEVIELPKKDTLDRFECMMVFIYQLNESSYDYMSHIIHQPEKIHHFEEAIKHLEIVDEWHGFRKQRYMTYFEDWCKKNHLEYTYE